MSIYGYLNCHDCRQTLWLGKALRLALLHAPLAAWSRLSGDREAWLGRRCLAAINARFLQNAITNRQCQ